MLAAIAALIASALPVPGPACRPAVGVTPAQAIARAISATGLDAIGTAVRVSSITDAIDMAYQSERTSPPYVWSSRAQKQFVDYAAGMLRLEVALPTTTVSLLSDGRRAVAIANGVAHEVALPQDHSLDEHVVDAWLTLSDWRALSASARVEECLDRDYWRTVVRRATPFGDEKLYLERKSGIPLKLERTEPHYLWGAVVVEYVWSIWTPIRGTTALAPRFSYRVVDGVVDDRRLATGYAMIPRDSAGPLILPENASPPVTAPSTPDTVRIAPTTFMLVVPGVYNNVVTLQADTVFVLDAQTSVERARQDSVWIGRLFPGKHPVAVVVTDGAWPHIAGVKYWADRGATVITHPVNSAFVTRVLTHVSPSEMAGRKTGARKVRSVQPVENGARAGGRLQLRSIDGPETEGALMVFLPAERYLYASDYLQNGGPTGFGAIYAREVETAVIREGFRPQTFSAMHVSVTDWKMLSRFTGRP